MHKLILSETETKKELSNKGSGKNLEPERQQCCKDDSDFE